MTQFEKGKFGWRRDDRTNAMARERGKKNVAYEDPTGRKFFAKYVDTASGELYAVDILMHEQAILQKLAATGVTPKPGEIKFYPNADEATKARLLIEYLSGTSLDRGAMLQQPNEVTKATASSLSRVHAAGILLVDVNPGAFLVRPLQVEAMEASVVDLEMAVDLNDATVGDIQRADYCYREHDLGYNMAFDQMPETGEERTLLLQRVRGMKRSEINLWARAMTDSMLGEAKRWPRLRFTDNVEAARQALARQLVEPLRHAMTPNILDVVDSWIEAGQVDPSERRVMAQRLLQQEFPVALERELLPVTLSERLQQAGIPLEPRVQDFLLKTLDPTIEQRPIDFSDLGV